jgi:hypothetical protein
VKGTNKQTRLQGAGLKRMALLLIVVRNSAVLRSAVSLPIQRQHPIHSRDRTHNGGCWRCGYLSIDAVLISQAIKATRRIPAITSNNISILQTP